MTKNSIKNLFFIHILLCFSCGVVAQSTVEPIYSYLENTSLPDIQNHTTLEGVARRISHDGRTGINMTSIRSYMELKRHTMKEKQGTVSLWFMPLEDMGSYDSKPGMAKSNPHYYAYSFLADIPNTQDYDQANFKLTWTPRWHPSLVAQFGKGNFYEDAFDMPHKAIVSISHVAFHAYKWYQLVLTWNYEKDEYSVFLNGILIGKEDQYKAGKLYRDEMNNSLYISNPALGFSEIKFYDRVLSEQLIYKQFKEQVSNFDKEEENKLWYTYQGKGRKKMQWSPDKEWKEKFSLTLRQPSDMDSLYVQGNPVDVRITRDGLLIETINKELTEALLDSQVYVWTNKPFEGDLYVEYEFKVLRPGGLSLLMVQASGMNREDFMADYPLRTAGRMTTVYGEDVRNYHWEYYRQMSDMTNHNKNSALMKNPYLYPLSFGALNTPVEIDKWHKLQFLQIGSKLIGAINGTIMVEFTDDGFTNNGPVYDFGRVAIRCMLRSKLLFRDLKIYNKEKIKTNSVEELIFQSGFEENCRVELNPKRSAKLTPGFETDRITGADETLSGKNDWVKDMDNNPDGGEFQLEYTGGDYSKRYAHIIPEPGNPTNKVLHFWLNDSWLASENQVKARIQADIYGIKKPYKEFYQSVRVFLHEDFNELNHYEKAINWLTLSEFWNNEWWVEGEKYGFRITLGVGKPAGPTDHLTFLLEAEDAGQIKIWHAVNEDIKVPVGKWFTMEYYYKEGNQDTGRFYMAITPDGAARQVVFDVTGYTYNTSDPSPNGVSGYNPMKLYTSKELVAFIKSKGKTLQIYWDDFKLWKNKRPAKK